MMYVITKHQDRKCADCPFYKAYPLKGGRVVKGCMARTPKEEIDSPKVCPLA